MNWKYIILGGVFIMITFKTKRISNKGINLIKNYEQLSLTKYNDLGGRPTIGWGHLIKENENQFNFASFDGENIISNTSSNENEDVKAQLNPAKQSIVLPEWLATRINLLA